MPNLLARLAGQSGIYAFGNAVLKAGGLLLLLLYLDPALLAQAEYGRLILLETAANIAIVMVGLGMAQGLLKYATDPEHAEDRSTLTFTTFATTAGLAGLFTLAVVVSAPRLAVWILNDAARAPAVRLMGVYAALKVLSAVPYMVLRIEERAGWFVTALVVEFTFLLGGVYYFLATRGLGLEGVLLGYVLSAGAVAALLSMGVLVRTRWAFQSRYARPLLAFGLPLVFANLAGVLLNTGDRFVVNALQGAEEVAVYGLAQKFGGLVYMLFVQSFSMAFAVLGLKALEETSGEVGNLHRRTFRHFAVLAGWGALGVSILALDTTLLISPNPAYRDAEPLILPISLGFVGYGIYYIAMNVLYAAKQTRRIAGNVIGVALLNLLLNLALVPPLGNMGAALATLISYVALAALTMWQARHVVQIAFPWYALASVTLLVVGLWMLAQPSVDWAVGYRLSWRLGLVALYPALVIGSEIYTHEEWRAIWKTMVRFVRYREHTAEGSELSSQERRMADR